MADRTITSREFRRDYIRLTEPTTVAIHGRVIGIWNPIGVAPAPRPAPETPAAGDSRSLELIGAGDVRTQGRTEALEGSPVLAVEEADGGGLDTAGGPLDSGASTPRKRQAARDRILRGVNRSGKP